MQLECYGVEKRQIWENWRRTWVYTATCCRGSFCFAMGSMVGAGPTLGASIRASAKQVIDSSLSLLREGVSSYGMLSTYHLLQHCCDCTNLFNSDSWGHYIVERLCNSLSMMTYVFECFFSPYHALPMRMLIKTTVDMMDPTVDGPWLKKLSGYMFLGIRSFLSQ